VAVVEEEGDSENLLQRKQDSTVAAKALKIEAGHLSSLSVNCCVLPGRPKWIVVVYYKLVVTAGRFDKTALFLGEGFVCPILIV